MIAQISSKDGSPNAEFSIKNRGVDQQKQMTKNPDGVVFDVKLKQLVSSGDDAKEIRVRDTVVVEL